MPCSINLLIPVENIEELNGSFSRFDSLISLVIRLHSLLRICPTFLSAMRYDKLSLFVD